MAKRDKKLLELGELTWQEAEKAFQDKKIVILPLGSIEQHGLHLPINTDLVLGEEMAEQVAERIGSILLLPVSFGKCGSFGNAKVAAPEKGDQLLRKLVDYIVEIIKSAWNFYNKKNTPQKGRVNES